MCLTFLWWAGLSSEPWHPGPMEETCRKVFSVTDQASRQQEGHLNASGSQWPHLWNGHCHLRPLQSLHGFLRAGLLVHRIEVTPWYMKSDRLVFVPLFPSKVPAFRSSFRRKAE